MSEPYYIYNADVYCEACAESIKNTIRHPKLEKDWYEEDSEQWPQGPYDDGDADTPQHCGNHENCLDPEVLSDGRKIGKFLENPLTIDGERYVIEMHVDNASEITRMWIKYYEFGPIMRLRAFNANGNFVGQHVGSLDSIRAAAKYEIDEQGGRIEYSVIE